MYNINNFSAAKMVSCGEVLRKLNQGLTCMEEVAVKITRFFHESFLDPQTGQSNFALVRFYKTHPFLSLPPELKNFAANILPKDFQEENFQCLTLLGSKGDRTEWNSRHTSRGHQAIPLFSENFVQTLPMVAGLVKAFGLKISDVISPDTSIQLENQSQNYNVFFVPQARGNSLIPAQENFIVPCKIASVIGFGGILPSREVYVVIIFSKVSIAKETAELFKPLARNIKAALLPFGKKVFVS